MFASARERLEDSLEIVDNFEHPEELYGIIVRRARVTRDIIERAKKLKVICIHGVGLDTIDMEAALWTKMPYTMHCRKEKSKGRYQMCLQRNLRKKIPLFCICRILLPHYMSEEGRFFKRQCEQILALAEKTKEQKSISYIQAL